MRFKKINFELCRAGSCMTFMCQLCEQAKFAFVDAGMGRLRQPEEIEKHLSEALGIMDDGMKKVRSSRVFYSVLVLLCIVALVFFSDFHLPFVPDIFFSFARLVLTVFLCFFVWMARVGNDREMNGLKAAKKDMNNLVKSLHMT